MKKKIAVFATGWSEQMIDEYMSGVRDGLENESADVYFFTCFPSLADGMEYTNGELNIFKLPNMDDFDGALVLGNTIDYPDVFIDLEKRCKASNVPIVYTGHRVENGYFVGIDNYYGARCLCEHLYNKHEVRDFFYIAGSKDNMDSNLRLQALIDVITENGGTFAEENVLYSDWSPKEAVALVDRWMESKVILPQAIVCANDELAILICEQLRKYGVHVPDDVIITGFDNLLFAQAYDPSISSVSQKFDKIGYESTRMLIDLIEGRECEKECSVQCEFLPRESCGCYGCGNTDEVRKKVGRSRFIDNMATTAFYRKLSLVDRCIMKSNCYDDLKNNFKSSNDIVFNNYEGPAYHIVIDPILKEKMYSSESEYIEEGYSEKMDVIFSLDSGNYVTYEGFETRKIVPQIADPSKNHLFICLPLQETGKSLGYVIFADDYLKFKNAVLMGKYVERLSAVLIKLQQTINARILNEKLLELSETDALTHVKNRMAYQAREKIINQKLSEGKEEFALILCDINDLKKMNDQWGHENGDAYIKNSCKLICTTFKRSAVFRLGGDEFAVILDGDDYKDAKSLLVTINEEMDRLCNLDIRAWDKVSVAMGIAYYDKNTDTCMADVLKKADNAMYLRKKEMKEKIGNCQNG